MGKKPDRNKVIVIINISAACLLFFCCCFFFFQNIGMFWSDLTSYLFFFPVLYFAGVVLVCLYIAVLVGKLESRQLAHADRWDFWYRIVFTVTLIILILRSFLGDFKSAGSLLNYHNAASIVIIVLAFVSGLVTWLTPKIKDNNNNEF